MHLLFLRDPHQHTGLRRGTVVSFDLLTLGNCKKEIFSNLRSTTELFKYSYLLNFALKYKRLDLTERNGVGTFAIFLK